MLSGVSNALNLIVIKPMGKKTVDRVAEFLEEFSHKEPAPDRLATYYGTARPIRPIDGPRFAAFTPHQIRRMVEEAGFSQISILPRITFVDYLDSQVLDEAAHKQGCSIDFSIWNKGSCRSKDSSPWEDIYSSRLQRRCLCD